MADLDLLRLSVKEAREGLDILFDSLGDECVFSVLKKFSKKPESPDQAVMTLLAAHGYSVALLERADKDCHLDLKQIQPSIN